MDLAHLEAVIHDAQELVDHLTEIARKIRLQQAIESLPDTAPIRKPWRPILYRVANERGFTVAGMLKGRRKDVVDARKEAYLLLREEGYNYSEIGRFCKRNRTSVMHALGVTK